MQPYTYRMRVCISRIWCAPLLCFGGVQGFVVAAGHGALCVTERQYTTRTAASRCTTGGVLERAAPQRGSRGRASRGRRSEAVRGPAAAEDAGADPLAPVHTARQVRQVPQWPSLLLFGFLGHATFPRERPAPSKGEHHDDQSSRKRYGPKLNETCSPRNMQPNTPETRLADPPVPRVWPAAC